MIVTAGAFSAFDQFLLVATTQIASHTVCVVISVLLQSPRGRRFLFPHPPKTLIALAAEFEAARQFFATGALLAATDQLPVILLNAFGFRAVIPAYEVARKLASVPEVLIHALSMHMMPRLVEHAG